MQSLQDLWYGGRFSFLFSLLKINNNNGVIKQLQRLFKNIYDSIADTNKQTNKMKQKRRPQKRRKPKRRCPLSISLRSDAVRKFRRNDNGISI